jgi:hypothetical protein
MFKKGENHFFSQELNLKSIDIQIIVFLSLSFLNFNEKI